MYLVNLALITFDSLFSNVNDKNQPLNYLSFVGCKSAIESTCGMVNILLLFATIFTSIFGFRIHNKISRFTSTLSSTTGSDAVLSTVERIKATVPISSVASKLIDKWTSVGSGKFVGLCPFHKDVNPSLHISDDLCLYHCFACGSSGDIISLVQKLEHLSFVEALNRIQELTGSNSSFHFHRYGWIMRYCMLYYCLNNLAILAGKVTAVT